MNAILTWLNDFLYIYILVALLTAAGIYFTIVTKGVQFRLLKEGLRTLTEKRASASGITSFQALMISTASRVAPEISLALLLLLPWAVLALYSGCG